MQQAIQPTDRRLAARNDLMVAFLCGSAVAAMVGIAYAAAPVFDLLCSADRYDGAASSITVAAGQGLPGGKLTPAASLHPVHLPAAGDAAQRSGRI